MIHSPHTRGQRGGRVDTTKDQDINLLNINQQVSSVCAGSLNGKNDILAIGTQTNILAYDVNNNSDLFYKDVSSILTKAMYFCGIYFLKILWVIRVKVYQET